MKILPATVIPHPAGGGASAAALAPSTGRHARSSSLPTTSVSRGTVVVDTGERMNQLHGGNDEKSSDVPLDPEAALTEFPELRRLVELLRAGWQLLPVSSGGELVEVRGVRVWPDEWLDAIVMRFTTDAAGQRRDRFGGVVWEHAGDLADVVDGLLALPAPNDLSAPRLVLRTSTRLWTP
jgi:hypothetical protein